MTALFRLTDPAIKDIEAIADYMAQQSGLERADQFLTAINRKFDRIAQFPKIGRSRHEILPNMRSLPFENYLILYIPYGQGVDILRVVSGYRDLLALFEDFS